MKILSASKLNVQYDQTTALKDVSFDLYEGDYLCIVGDNGSGKSTLVKTLLGLVKPKSGNIDFHSRITQEEIGYLPQTTHIQRDFPASVMEVVLSGCLNRRKWNPFYSRAEKARALKNLRRLDIEDLKHKSFRALSGGQQQRVLIARALCASEKVLLLDEPVTGLDPQTTASLYELIEKLNQELGMTIIMITHDVGSGLKSASKVLHLRKEVLFFGSLEDYQQEELAKCHRGGLRHA
ncbi:MAG: ABC transporter ATP-binding protein [Turicibacter sp.]|nr:ABC transporter ATP-binding protein [Turicibacter sp.]